MKKSLCLTYIGLTLLFTTFCFTSLSQNQNNHWYFGQYAAWDFTGSIRSDDFSARDNKTIFSEESTNSLSDATSGNLLFYTNGGHIWNSSHTPINTVLQTPVFPWINPSGTLDPITNTFPLFNHGYQSLISCPVPGSTDEYFLFGTPDNGTAAANNLQYALVDLSSASGIINPTGPLCPNGQNVLINPSQQYSEAINLIPHCNGKDYWLLAKRHISGQIDVFLVSQYGVSPSFVPTNLLSVGGGSRSLKASPNNDKIATNIGGDLAIVEFDNSQGLFGMVQILNNPNGGTNLQHSFNSTGTTVFTVQQNPTAIYSVDVMSGTFSNAPIAVPLVPIIDPGIQLAPDDNIYMTRGTNSGTFPATLMSRIINANTANPTFEDQTIPLNTNSPDNDISDWIGTSIPNQMDGNIPNYTPPSFTTASVNCMTIELSVPSCWDGYDYEIDWGGGTPATSLHTSLPQNVQHAYPSGTHTITVTWLPKGATSVPAGFTPITATQTVTILPLPGPANYVFTNPTTQDIYNEYNNFISPSPPVGIGAPIVGFSFGVHGTLTVDQDLYLDNNAHVYMAPGAKIVVDAGGTLVTMTTRDGAIIEAACNTMWDGIEILSTNAKADFDNTYIKDMKKGVQVNALGELKSSAWYWDNYISIQLENLPVGNNSNISGNEFRTDKPFLLAPYSTWDVGMHGILMKNCPSMTFTNDFDGLRNGMYILQDDNAIGPVTMTTSNSKFKNIIYGGANSGGGFYGWVPQGSGIFFWNKTGQDSKLIHHGQNLQTNIDFEDCTRAIMTNNTTIDAQYNYMENVDHGIYAYQLANHEGDILFNHIKDAWMGVLVNGNSKRVLVEHNDIWLKSLSPVIPGEFYPNAPRVAKGISANFYNNYNWNTYESIDGNEISSDENAGVIGIEILSGLNISCDYNDIKFDATTSYTGTDLLPNLKGISITNTKHTLFTNNRITGSSNPLLLRDNKSTGFYLHRSPRNGFYCNKNDYLQFGLYVIADNNTGDHSSIGNNRFATSKAGIMYRHLANEGQLGKIGEFQTVQPYTRLDANNKFNPQGFSNQRLAKLYRVTGLCNNLPSFDNVIFTKQINVDDNTSLFTESEFSGINSCKVIVNNDPDTDPNTTIFDCGVSAIPLSANFDGVTDPDHAEDIATDQVIYSEFPEGGEEMDERDLYHWLYNDNGVLATRPILNSFYLASQQEPLAYLHEVDMLIASLHDANMVRNSTAYITALNAAKSLNNQIISTEDFELNERWVNSLYLDMLTEGWLGFDSIQVDSLIQLSLDCPYLGGFGVFKARMLAAHYVPNMHYDDLWICNNLGVYKNGNTQFNEENELINKGRGEVQRAENGYVVYPNPTAGFIQVQYMDEGRGSGTMFTLYNLLGKVVYKQALHSNYNNFTLPKLANGIYTYTISNDAQIIKQDKLMLDN